MRSGTQSNDRRQPPHTNGSRGWALVSKMTRLAALVALPQVAPSITTIWVLLRVLVKLALTLAALVLVAALAGTFATLTLALPINVLGLRSAYRSTLRGLAGCAQLIWTQIAATHMRTLVAASRLSKRASACFSTSASCWPAKVSMQNALPSLPLSFSHLRLETKNFQTKSARQTSRRLTLSTCHTRLQGSRFAWVWLAAPPSPQ